MRDTSKLLQTSLLILSIALAALLPASASAHAAGGNSHQTARARHEASRLARRRRRRERMQTRAQARHARALERAAKKQQRAEANARRNQDAARSTAATIADVLATPCQNTEITPEPANIALVKEAVLCLVNRERAEHSLAPLKANPELEAAAEDHNAEMLRLDYFAHVAPDGETPVERIKKTGYIASEADGYVIGENLAWGTYSLSTPKAIVEAWIASPGHLANILESRYVETGVGVAPAVPESLGEGNPGATYAQEFGVIVQ